MKVSEIKKVTILCETKDGRYIVGDSCDRELIFQIADKVAFVEIKPNCVRKIDADKITVKEKQKLF